MSSPGNALNISAAGIVIFNGVATFTATTTTQFNALVGNTNNTIANIAPSATSGVPFISQGAASNPAFGTAVVAGGGTGRTTLTDHGVLIGRGTAAIDQTAAGTAGQVLQSGGAGGNPAYSTATYPSTAGTSGNVLTSDGTNWNSTAPAGAATVFTTKVSLTSAQIKTLNASPVQIVAAPGASKIIHIVDFTWKFTYGGSNVFVAGASQTLNLFYSTTASIGAAFLSNAQIVGTTTLKASAPTTAVNSSGATTNENLAVNIWQANPTEISGNAANNNTLNMTVMYYIADVS